ncbi:hypothetical protein BJV82DRAFT_508741 [Fennellomyces sp. T-0311]|nr:hypothetical protein BJV82DRAFT_508741 [Fennellomyces sp. T-0311]
MSKLTGTVYDSKFEVRDMVQAEALVNGFAVSTRRSNKRNIYMRYIHGGNYENWHNVTEENRIRRGSTH